MKFKIFSILLAMSAMTLALANPDPRNLTSTSDSGNLTSQEFPGVVHWAKIEDSTSSSLILAGKELHGGRSNYRVYVGRIIHNEDEYPPSIVPGKWVADYDGWFYYNYNNTAYSNQTNFEVLQYLPGTLSWIYGSNGVLPVDAIVGGYDGSTQEVFYICRGLITGNLIVGRVTNSSNSCLVPWRGQRTIKVYEILALNSLGRFLAEHEGNNPARRVSNPTFINGRTVEIGCAQNVSGLTVNIYNSNVTFN